MKRLLILWLLLPLLSAAKVPVESDIKARIEDPASEQYYPNLRLRYEQADSTLTAEDYHYLYYGYAYQPQYRPLETNPALDRFYETLARLNVDAPADTDLLAVIEAGTEALEADPFSPQVLNFLSFAHAQRGDTAQAAAYRDKMNLVLATIESSGDGRDPMAYPDVRARLRPVGRQEHSGARELDHQPHGGVHPARQEGRKGSERVLFRLRPHLLEKARTGV